MEEIEFSRWLFEGRLRQGKNVLPDGLNWLRYFPGSSKSHRENPISFKFHESPHQVDMKNVVKCWKDFLSYFTTLETYRELLLCPPNPTPSKFRRHCYRETFQAVKVDNSTRKKKKYES